MLRATLIVGALLALCAPAAAGAPPPVDIFDDVFATRAAQLHPDLKPSRGICDDGRHCLVTAAPGVLVLVHAPADAEPVDGASVVAPYDGRAASPSFAGACDTLMALLSGGMPDAVRRAVLNDLLDRARHDGSAERSEAGATYRMEIRDDHRIVLVARAP